MFAARVITLITLALFACQSSAVPFKVDARNAVGRTVDSSKDINLDGLNLADRSAKIKSTNAIGRPSSKRDTIVELDQLGNKVVTRRDELATNDLNPHPIPPGIGSGLSDVSRRYTTGGLQSAQPNDNPVGLIPGIIDA